MHAIYGCGITLDHYCVMFSNYIIYLIPEYNGEEMCFIEKVINILVWHPYN